MLYYRYWILLVAFVFCVIQHFIGKDYFLRQVIKSKLDDISISKPSVLPSVSFFLSYLVFRISKPNIRLVIYVELVSLQ